MQRVSNAKARPLLTAYQSHPIPFHKPNLGSTDRLALLEAFDAGEIGGGGSVGREVEKRLQALFQVNNALLMTNCSHSLEMALLIAGVSPGDEVLVPSFTFASCANAIVLRGAIPVFVEVAADTMTIDPADIEHRITPRTKAIMPVHYAGVAADLDPIMEIAAHHNLIVIEDAAQGVDAKYKGHYLGTIGHMGAYSFHSTKNITCGEGGAFLTSNAEFARHAEIIHEKGTNRAAFLRGESDKYSWVSVGSSYVLSDLLAALLNSQLDQMNAIRARRQAIDSHYRAGLADLEAAGLLQIGRIPHYAESNYHIFYVLLKDRVIWEETYSAMREQGVQATFHYVPLDTAPFGQQIRPAGYADLTRTNDLAGRLLRLPIYPDLSDDEVDYVIEAMHRALGQ
ncbi:dTDP-4-amino-4,6-dideoxygalactose transaminase [bacterium]|nr:dTDP-4-amino-4,6-dideoxygalactose transaminase [bacterium]